MEHSQTRTITPIPETDMQQNVGLFDYFQDILMLKLFVTVHKAIPNKSALHIHYCYLI